MITLYFNWNAVCAQKVLLCLEEKGLPRALKHIDLAKFEQHQPWYLELNPGGVVPALTDGDHVFIESTVINEYLDDAYPGVPLKPASPVARARMRWWGKQVDDIVHPSIRPISFTKFATEKAKSMSAEERAAMIGRTPKKEIAELWTRVVDAPYSAEELANYLHKIETVLEKMEKDLGAQPWLAGDTFSLADLNMLPYFRRLMQLEKQDLWAARPAVAGWLARMQARPSYAIFDQIKSAYAK